MFEDWGEGEEITKAEYQGREVPLNKPRRLSGENKKFEVFVQSGGKVKRVTFGDPDMEIRRDDPDARAAFRARHSCDTAKDKTSARYWSCRMWEAGSTVSENTKMQQECEILKVDEEQRLAYGWAYVSTQGGQISYDHSREWIKPSTLEKSATEFMMTARVSKLNHSGEQIAEIVHSLPVTKEVAESLGIQTDREGWIIGVKVFDEDVWENVKSGKLSSFSIGGIATGGNPKLRG
jgi:uncharacterized protein YndB with AHSA1/START domain